MMTTDIVSRYDLIRLYEQEYDAGIEAGNILPFVYPIASYAAAIVLVFMLIPPRFCAIHFYGKYCAFAVMLYSSMYTIAYCRSRTMALGFGIGLMAAWGIIWSATLLIFNDAKHDFRRLERIERGISLKAQAASGFCASGTNFQSNHIGAVDPAASVRKRASAIHPNEKMTAEEATLGPFPRDGIFVWQSWPVSPFSERLDWVLDLFCNFRGVGWNWRISGLPSYPPYVQAQLQGTRKEEIDTDIPVSYSGIVRFETKERVLRHNLYRLVEGYLIIDVLKTLMNHDPYFWGLTDRLPPPYYPEFLLASPFLIHSYRLVVVMVAVGIALRSCFSMAAPFFVGILGTKAIGVRGEPWYYPDSFGSFSNVLDNGLAGWWGCWWHQTFRFGFQAGGNWVVARLGLQKKSLGARTIQLFVAFALSGFLHASGSMTQTGPTRPWSGPFLFFILQPFGILCQMALAKFMVDRGISQRMPKPLRRAANFMYVHLWFFGTGSLLCDDWARGGIFLFEPIALSPLRGLGFGVAGDKFWCWSGPWAHWHRGKYWWSSGIAP